MSAPARSSVTLRALEGRPLSDAALREMVVATARAIAERQGVDLLELATAEDSVTATLASGQIEAVGFAAELRRVTETWYTRKYGRRTLWGDPPTEDAGTGEHWKRA